MFIEFLFCFFFLFNYYLVASDACPCCMFFVVCFLCFSCLFCIFFLFMIHTSKRQKKKSKCLAAVVLKQCLNDCGRIFKITHLMVLLFCFPSNLWYITLCCIVCTCTLYCIVYKPNECLNCILRWKIKHLFIYLS